MLVAEDGELLLDIGLDIAGDQPQQHDRENDGQRQGNPHAHYAQGPHARQRGNEAHAIQPQDLAEGRQRIARVRRDHLEVVHAEPAGEGQGNQEHEPNKSRVLDPGVGARFNTTNQGTAGVLQLHRVASQGAEDTCGHHQRNHDLHGGHAEVAQAGIHAQAVALFALGIEGADIAHGAGKVAATNTRQQGQGLEDNERGIRVHQRDAGARGR